MQYLLTPEEYKELHELAEKGRGEQSIREREVAFKTTMLRLVMEFLSNASAMSFNRPQVERLVQEIKNIKL